MSAYALKRSPVLDTTESSGRANGASDEAKGGVVTLFVRRLGSLRMCSGNLALPFLGRSHPVYE